MPRRNRPKRSDPEPVQRSWSTVDIAAPPGWQAVRHMGGDRSRTYKCPRCERSFAADVEHVVAWTTEQGEYRRHWHSACWQAAQREGLDRYRWA